jgi:hypothetical protein
MEDIMTIPQIKEKIKRNKRLSEHITQQLSKPLDDATTKLKLRQSHQVNKERLHLEKMLEDLNGRKN